MKELRKRKLGLGMESDCLGMLVPFRLDWAGRTVALKLRPE